MIGVVIGNGIGGPFFDGYVHAQQAPFLEVSSLFLSIPSAGEPSPSTSRDDEIVILAQLDSLEEPAPDSPEIDLEARAAIGDRRNRPRTDRVSLGFVTNLRRQIARGEPVCDRGRGRPGRRIGHAFLDGVDLPPGQREIIVVGAAHQRRHLAPPVVGEVGNLIGAAQQSREPRRGPGPERRVSLLVQGCRPFGVGRARGA